METAQYTAEAGRTQLSEYLETVPCKKNGAALAAILSASIGCFVIGIAIILAEVSEGAKNMLNWWGPAGPLTGKTGVGVIIWLLLWFILHKAWKDKDLDIKKVLTYSFVLLAISFIFSFPPFFTLFASH